MIEPQFPSEEKARTMSDAALITWLVELLETGRSDAPTRNVAIFERVAFYLKCERDLAEAQRARDEATRDRDSWKAMQKDARDAHERCIARLAAAEGQLRTLVDAVDRVVKSEAYKSPFIIAAVHGMPYSGPDFKIELDAARKWLQPDAETP